MTRRPDLWTLAHALAVLAIGLIAGTALAHVLEMPHKLAMTGEAWLPVQQVLYNGWGAKLFWLDVAAVAGLAMTIIRFPASRALAAVALALLLLADVAVFRVWIEPTNAALDAWTAAEPMEAWQSLRANWEWGHAARAAILTLAMLIALLAAPVRSDGDEACRLDDARSA